MAADTAQARFTPPDIPRGVVPPGASAPVLASDSYDIASVVYPQAQGFPGFSYLAMLATRAEYRAFASSISTELTREGIKITSSDTEGDNEKVATIEREFERLRVMDVIQRAAEHDCLFGRAQIFIDIDGQSRALPLVLDPRTVPVGSLRGFRNVEAIWTTPSSYNALDPAAADFYKPTAWYMMGQTVSASRLMTIVTRPLPDILKPAFNFAGMSLSQLAEPYVDNWLRTRQSVSDLIDKFSTSILKTAMEQILQGDGDAQTLIDRAKLFTATKSNQGLVLLDKETEELVQINTPLGGLDKLQAQAQEHMCSVSRLPSVILTGINPSGLNASSEGEIRVFYDWIAAQQNSFWRTPIETMLGVIQLSLFGEIDPDISFEFVPLYQMTPRELADIREADCRTSTAYIAAGVLDTSEVRERLASDPDSGYLGLDVTSEIYAPEIETDSF